MFWIIAQNIQDVEYIQWNIHMFDHLNSIVQVFGYVNEFDQTYGHLNSIIQMFGHLNSIIPAFSIIKIILSGARNHLSQTRNILLCLTRATNIWIQMFHILVTRVEMRIFRVSVWYLSQILDNVEDISKLLNIHTGIFRDLDKHIQTIKILVRTAQHIQ
jgi:hypothetical protein